MTRMPSAAAEALLEAMGADLQRQLNRTAILERLSVREGIGVVTLVADLRVAKRDVQLQGTGENVLAAYAELLHRAPEPILASAFEQVLET